VRDVAEAVRWFERAAAWGDEDAKAELGRIRSGNPVAQT